MYLSRWVARRGRYAARAARYLGTWLGEERKVHSSKNSKLHLGERKERGRR
jgi:hypothetical protein